MNDGWMMDDGWVTNGWMDEWGMDVMDEAHLGCTLQLVHLVAAQQALDEHFYFAIELHECHIAGVAHQQAEAFPHHNLIIQKEIDEHEQSNDIEGDVSEQRPPGEVQHLFGEQGAHPDHKQDVEYSRAHDGADSYITVGDKDSNDRGEELWGWAACSHEGGSCDIIRDLQLLCDDS